MSPRDTPTVSLPTVSLPAGAFRPDIDRRIGFFHWAGFMTLFRREMKRVRKMTAMVVIAPAFMAMIYFACFAFGLGDQRGTAAGDAVLDHLVPGLVMLSLLLRAAENTSFSLIYSKIEGMVVDQLMAPVGARETVTAYALAGTAAGLISGMAVWLGALLLWPVPVTHPWAVLLFGVLGALMMALAGLLVGIAGRKWDHLSAAFTFLFMPVSFLSGLFAPVDRMPQAFQMIVQSNPIFYAMDGFRYGILGTSHQDPAVSALILSALCLALFMLAARLYSVGWRLKN